MKRIGLTGLVLVIACGGTRSRESDSAAPTQLDDTTVIARTTPAEFDAAPAVKIAVPGQVRVSVRLREPSPARVRPGALNGCGQPKLAPVRVHTLGGLPDAVVVLEGETPRDLPQTPVTVVLDVEDCRLGRRVVILPERRAGLALVNRSELRQHVVLAWLSGDQKRKTTVSLPLIGQRYEWTPNEAGIVQIHVGSDADRPSYVVIAEHPHTGTTDDTGDVVFSEVAPGKYRVNVWYGPFDESGKRLRSKADVVVREGQVAEVETILVEEG